MTSKALIPTKRKDAIAKGEKGAGFRRKKPVEEAEDQPTKLGTKPRTSRQMVNAAVLHGHAKTGDVDKVREALLQTDIDMVDERGKTALMFAAVNGHKEVVELLLKRGADEFIHDIKGKTALDYARQNVYTEIAELLEQAMQNKK